MAYKSFIKDYLKAMLIIGAIIMAFVLAIYVAAVNAADTGDVFSAGESFGRSLMNGGGTVSPESAGQSSTSGEYAPAVPSGTAAAQAHVEKYPKVRYCVSFSLPTIFLRAAVIDALRLRESGVNIALSFQGFHGGTLNAVIKRVVEFQRDSGLEGRELPFEIDPEFFATHNITRVPQTAIEYRNGEVAIVGGLGLSASVEKLAFALGSRNIGNLGPVYEIAEENLLALIERRVKSPEVQARIAASMQKAWSRAFEPKYQLPAATQSRAWHVDPTYELPEDVLDQNGNVLFAQGTRLHPADFAPLTGRYVVVDGRDEAQMRFALAGEYRQIMLAGGNLLDTMKQYHKRFYMVSGEIIDRLGIKHVPAVFEQDGRNIKVTEVALR